MELKEMTTSSDHRTKVAYRRYQSTPSPVRCVVLCCRAVTLFFLGASPDLSVPVGRTRRGYGRQEEVGQRGIRMYILSTRFRIFYFVEANEYGVLGYIDCCFKGKNQTHIFFKGNLKRDYPMISYQGTRSSPVSKEKRLPSQC